MKQGKLPLFAIWALIVVAALVIGFLDYYTGYEIHLFAIYFIPVGIAAWYMGQSPAVFVSFFCIIVWSISDLASHHPYSASYIQFWNGIIRLVSFLIIAFALSRLKKDFNEQRQLNADLNRALEQVKQLKGMLPICASCKMIRNDKGYWEQIESYIQNHSEAQFTHGLCPDCAKRLYPEFSMSENGTR